MDAVVHNAIKNIKGMRSKVFKTSGTFTTGPTVTEVYVTGCGAGGGGGGYDGVSNYVSGISGGTTSFGSGFSLIGGFGGSMGYGGPGSGSGGGGGIGNSHNQGGGGFSSISAPYAKGALGSGGGGVAAGGGGAGDYVFKRPVTVIPSTVYTITIGTGGAGGVQTQSGKAGGDGYMLIEWWEG